MSDDFDKDEHNRHMDELLRFAEEYVPDNKVSSIADYSERRKKKKTGQEEKETLDLQKALYSYDELINAEIPERRLLLPWLPEGGLAMVFGQRGLGKTFFGLSLAAAAAQGQPFMKWHMNEPTGVLYIDGEMWLGDIRERIKRFAGRPLRAELQTLSHERFFELFEKDLTITDSDVQEAMLEVLDASNDINLLVIDNLSSLSRIREDKSDDWRHVMLPFLIACRRRGVAVVMIHHAGKGGDQRGTGAREDHLDTSIKLSLPDEADPSDGCHFRVDFTKNRGCFGKAIDPFTAKLEQMPYGGMEWTIASIEQGDKDRLIRLITDAGEEGISVGEAEKELGLPQYKISRMRKQLDEEGIIQTSSKRKSPMKIAINWLE